MATLWALTGRLDARRSNDMKVADVVNDESNVRQRKIGYSIVLVSLLTRFLFVLCYRRQLGLLLKDLSMKFLSS